MLYAKKLDDEGLEKVTCIIIALLVIGFIVIIDVPYMLKNKLKKELWASSALLLLGVVLSVVHGMNKPIPNPLEGMEFVYKPISDLFDLWLK